MAAALAGAETAEAAVAALEEGGFRHVHIAIPDLDASLRERRLPLEEAIRALRGGFRFVNVLHQWDTADSVHDGAERFVDEAVAVDPGSGRNYPFEAEAAHFIADYAGPSAVFSPRELLKTQLARAAAMGFSVKAALEFEFIVLEENARTLRESGFGRLTPWPMDNRCWAGLTAATHAGFVAELDGLLRSMGIDLFSLGLELGPGCFEATLRARDPLGAADEATLFRTVTKAFCRQRDLTASFMAQLSTDFPGLSGHVHLSLADAATGAPLFFDPAAPEQASDTLRHFVGGMLAAMPELTGLVAHTVNAYRRMVPGNWSPRTPTWGFGNYTTAVRACTRDAGTARVEFRVPAADTNPYLAIATALASGLGGIERARAGDAPPLPPPVEGDGRLADTGGVTLPASLLEAADRLATGALARPLFGAAFVDHFVRSRRIEDAAFRRHVSGFERARYLEAL